MHRARATEGQHRKSARIVALFDDVHSGGVGHTFVHHTMNSKCRIFDTQTKRLRNVRVNRALRCVPMKRHLSAQKKSGIEVPQHQIRIGHRGPCATASVASRPGIGAGAGRANAQQAKRIKPGDTAATSTNLNHVNHGHANRKTAPLLEAPHARRFKVRGNLRSEILDQRSLRGRSSHIKREEVGQLRCPTHMHSGHRSAGRSRFQ